MRNEPRLLWCLQHFCSLSERGKKNNPYPIFFFTKNSKTHSELEWSERSVPEAGADPSGAGSSSTRCRHTGCGSTKPSRCKSTSREHRLLPELFPVWISSR